MRLKEHSNGCMCANCQDQFPVDNIDGYASGYELAPTPDQEIPSDQLNDPNFIASIITQVLQQLGDEGTLEEWAPMDDYEHVRDDVRGVDTAHDDILTDPNTILPMGGPCGPWVPVEYSEAVNNQKTRIQEGSCGYTETPDGQQLSTPGGTKGMSANDRTNHMLKQYVQQEIKKLKKLQEIEDDVMMNLNPDGEVEIRLEDLTFDMLTQTFPEEYSGEYSRGVTMPNSDDSRMSISSESHLEAYKEKIERWFGNVNIVLKPNANNWFDKTFIDDEKFNQQKDNFIRGKMSAMQRDDERGWSTD